MWALVVTSTKVPLPRFSYKIFFAPGRPRGPHITGTPFHTQELPSPGLGVVAEEEWTQHSTPRAGEPRRVHIQKTQQQRTALSLRAPRPLPVRLVETPRAVDT